MRTDTADTAAKMQAYQRKPAPLLACTPDTADTAEKINTGANAANDPQQADPDRHCYPHSSAANTSELDLMGRRLEQFKRLGLDVDTSERLADLLMLRDRDPQDDRRMCIECQNCQHGRCCNSRAAGLNHPELGQDYALALKRCNGHQQGIGTLAGTPLSFTPPPPRPPIKRTEQGHPLTPQQKEAAQEYNRHHFGCPKCRTAGQGRSDRCQKGSELWAKYQGVGDG